MNRLHKDNSFAFAKKALLLWLIVSFPFLIIAQRSLVPNQLTYDKQVMHFGFLIGLNVADFTIKRKGEFNFSDSIYSVESSKQSGFNLGIVSDMKMGNNFDLRFIPTLSFASRNLVYDKLDFSGKFVTVIKKIESTFIEFPLEIKFKSNRVKNYRIFVLAGGKYMIDMVSQAKVKSKDKDFVKLKRNDYGYTIGAGIDCYMERFKMAFEIKMYHGLDNLLVPDPSIYSKTIDKLNSKIFSLGVTFE